MIVRYDEKYLDDIMKIWLDTNISAHDFIDESYWRGNQDYVERLLPMADISIYIEDEEVRGFIGVVDGFIAGIFVKEKYQNQGIGESLVDHIKEEHEELNLNVYSKNENAIKFYEENGFKISKEMTNRDTKEKEYLMKWSV